MGIADQRYDDFVRAVARQEIEANSKTRLWARVAVVTSTSPSLLVRFYGDTADSTASLRLSSYTAAQADKVLCVWADNQWIVVGKVVTAP